MLRRSPSTPPDDARGSDPTPRRRGGGFGSEPDLATLPVLGISRRRAAILLGVLLAAWVVILFARQVSEASSAAGRAEAMVAANAARRDEVAAMEVELQRIQQVRYVVQQARGYGLGGPHEIAFTLAADAPPLPADAPGSAGQRVGAPPPVAPFDRWLTLLFGPAD